MIPEIKTKITVRERVEATLLFSKFLGWEKIRVGWFEDSSQTKWQVENPDWMDKLGVGTYLIKEEEGEYTLFADAQFHGSWDWIMPVVKKFMFMQIPDWEYTCHKREVKQSFENYKFEQVFRALLNALRWLQKAKLYENT